MGYTAKGRRNITLIENVLRIPGGWLYRMLGFYNMSIAFVPEPNNKINE